MMPKNEGKLEMEISARLNLGSLDSMVLTEILDEAKANFPHQHLVSNDDDTSYDGLYDTREIVAWFKEYLGTRESEKGSVVNGEV